MPPKVKEEKSFSIYPKEANEDNASEIFYEQFKS
jgi:hypothetical protein